MLFIPDCGFILNGSSTPNLSQLFQGVSDEQSKGSKFQLPGPMDTAGLMLVTGSSGGRGVSLLCWSLWYRLSYLSDPTIQPGLLPPSLLLQWHPGHFFCTQNLMLDPASGPSPRSYPRLCDCLLAIQCPLVRPSLIDPYLWYFLE